MWKRGYLLEFNDEHGVIPLRALPHDETRTVKLWKILACCREHMFAGSTINIVVRDDQASGSTKISPDELMNHTRILIKTEKTADGSYLLCKEGIKEKPIDHFFRLIFVPDRIRNRCWDKRTRIALSGEETRLRVAEAPQLQPEPQSQQQHEVPELARDEELRRQGGPNDHQSQTRAYLEEKGNPDDQISNSSSTTDEEIGNLSLIIPSQRSENMPVEDDINNITGGSDGITRAAANPTPQQETFRGSSSTEIAGRFKKDRVHSLGGTASQSNQELFMNALTLANSEDQNLSRRMGELEAKFEAILSMLSMQQYPPN